LPIIVVAEGDGHLVTALDAGADDYIAKPFVVEVLLARMRAALRRGAHDRSTGRHRDRGFYD
jgi:two-component system KDP operon response regulator KdpE